jgi:hypothetical protein
VKEKAMSRLFVLWNFTITLALCVLCGALYLRSNSQVAVGTQNQLEFAKAVQSPGALANTDQLASSLSKIDIRLSALEHAVSRANPAASSTHQSTPRMPIAEADLRLKRMLPVTEINIDEMMVFHQRLAQLPVDEQSAISAAFSRATNENRIRMRP